MPELTGRIISPIIVTHAFVVEIHFSTYGKTEQGKAMATPGPGGLQKVRLHRPVVLPSVCLLFYYRLHRVRDYPAESPPAFL